MFKCGKWLLGLPKSTHDAHLTQTPFTDYVQASLYVAVAAE